MSVPRDHHRKPGRVRAVELGALDALRTLHDIVIKCDAPHYVWEALMDVEGWLRTDDEPQAGVQHPKLSDT